MVSNITFNDETNMPPSPLLDQLSPKVIPLNTQFIALSDIP